MNKGSPLQKSLLLRLYAHEGRTRLLLEDLLPRRRVELFAITYGGSCPFPKLWKLADPNYYLRQPRVIPGSHEQSMRADGANTRICNSTSPPSTSSDYRADYRCSRTIAVRADYWPTILRCAIMILPKR